MGSLNNKSIMPCAACKILRRRCTNDCIFLPYFPPNEPEKFAAVHRIFGASNISKFLQEVPVNDRDDTVISMVYEAKARLRDPVYGCVGLIASLQNHVFHLQSELNDALAEALALRTQLSHAWPSSTSSQAHLSAYDVEERNSGNLHCQQLVSKCNNFSNTIDAMLLMPHLLDFGQASDVLPEP